MKQTRSSIQALSIACAMTFCGSVLAQAQITPDNAQAQMQTMACQGYRDNVITSVRMAEQNLSDEGLRAENLAPISRPERMRIMRDIVEGLVEAETDPQSRRIITQAANQYLRSGNVDAFAQGLNGLVDACVQAAASNQQPTPSEQASPQTPEPQAAPAPGNNWRYRSNPNSGQDTQQDHEEQPRSRLPERESYL